MNVKYFVSHNVFATHAWPTVTLILFLWEKALTIDRIQFQDSTHIQRLCSDQPQNGNVPQTYVTMTTTTTVTTHIRKKHISSTKSQTANKDIVSVICWPNVFYPLLISADFTVLVYYLNHPQHRFLGKGRRTWWSGESCQRAVSSEARKPTLNAGERRLYLVRAKCWIPGSNLSGPQPSQQDRPLSGAGREQPWVPTQPRATH